MRKGKNVASTASSALDIPLFLTAFRDLDDTFLLFPPRGELATYQVFISWFAIALTTRNCSLEWQFTAQNWRADETDYEKFTSSRGEKAFLLGKFVLLGHKFIVGYLNAELYISSVFLWPGNQSIGKDVLECHEEFRARVSEKFDISCRGKNASPNIVIHGKLGVK